jgi:hypothetical protein
LRMAGVFFAGMTLDHTHLAAVALLEFLAAAAPAWIVAS